MRDLVNFVLRCSGTDLKVDTHDIEDVDNVPNRLNDLQEEYQAQNITDYPLISRSKKYKSFQSVLTRFFDDLIQTIHESSVLYSDAALIENVQVWITSMSSAPIRPFRHTATIISLTIVTALCHIARQVSATLSNNRKQLETEKKKKNANKGRITAMQEKIQEGEKKLETIDEVLRDSFDTVFVHRYRDVDPKIRAECINTLGLWISLYREMFFEGQYLRYLGWVLSDTVAHTRSVVVHQLRQLFQNKNNVPGLRAFTERFRPRIVEIAIRDAEPSVRTSAVELLDLIRDAGLLEPDDIDSVGRLVFDLEPRVRKAAGRFFVSNIQDVYDSLTESLEEEVDEMFAEEDEDDLESPKRSWIKYKCLVDMLQVYDGQESDLQEEQEPPVARPSFMGSSSGSRFVLATESIYPHFKELDQWESLAGYLLYDHSQIPEPSGDDDATNAVKNLYKIGEGQEGVLLEVLGCAVKLHLQVVSKSDTDKKGRKTKQSTQLMEERLESIAHNLSQIIPQLLNKFGAVPEAASAVLKLEHLVNLDLIQDMQKDAAVYSDIMNNINKQFLTHSDRDVLAEATVAFLHARTSDELKEAMESKIQELWDDTISSLCNLGTNKKVQDLQSLPANTLTTLSNTVMRISNLASVSDCTSTLESPPPDTRSKKQKTALEPPVELLLSLAKRGLREEESNDDMATLERELITSTFRTLLVYFMWKVQALIRDLSSGNDLASYNGEYFETLKERRESFVSTLSAIVQYRRPVLNEIRLAATTTLLDLQTVFGTLRHAGSDGKGAIRILDEDMAYQTQELVQEISHEMRNIISSIHATAERVFAKKSNKKLDLVADDDDLVDPQADLEIESDDENEDDDEDADENENDAKLSLLLAEQRLCELTGKIVLAIIGNVLDSSGSQAGKLKKKLLKNKSRLGPNYKEVIAYLDDSKGESGVARRGGTGAAGDNQANANVNNNKFKSVERVQDDDEEEDGEEGDVGLDDDEENAHERELLEEEEQSAGEGESEREEREETRPSPDEDDIMGD